jgi:hypothetical protein
MMDRQCGIMGFCVVILGLVIALFVIGWQCYENVPVSHVRGGGIVIDSSSTNAPLGAKTFRKSGTCETTSQTDQHDIVVWVPENINTRFTIKVRVVASYGKLRYQDGCNTKADVINWTARKVGFRNTGDNTTTLSCETDTFIQNFSKEVNVELNCPIITVLENVGVVVRVSGANHDYGVDGPVLWAAELEVFQLCIK